MANETSKVTKTYSVVQRNPNSWAVTPKGNVHEVGRERSHAEGDRQ